MAKLPIIFTAQFDEADFDARCRILARMTSRNDHSKAVEVLCASFDITQHLVPRAALVVLRHNLDGHLTIPNSAERTLIMESAVALLRAALPAPKFDLLNRSF